MKLPAALRRLLNPYASCGRHRADDRIAQLTVERDAARADCRVLRDRLAGADQLIESQFRQLLDVRLDNNQVRIAHRQLADELAATLRALDRSRAETIEIPVIKVVHAPANEPPRSWTAAEGRHLSLVGGA
jgi:hypothetical protein